MTENDWIEVNHHSDLIDTYVEISSSLVETLNRQEAVVILRKSDSSQVTLEDSCDYGNDHALVSTCRSKFNKPKAGYKL